MNNVIDFINTNRDRYVDELKEYLAIPSISALPEHTGATAATTPAVQSLYRFRRAPVQSR